MKINRRHDKTRKGEEKRKRRGREFLEWCRMESAAEQQQRERERGREEREGGERGREERDGESA